MNYDFLVIKRAVSGKKNIPDIPRWRVRGFSLPFKWNVVGKSSENNGERGYYNWDGDGMGIEHNGTIKTSGIRAVKLGLIWAMDLMGISHHDHRRQFIQGPKQKQNHETIKKTHTLTYVYPVSVDDIFHVQAEPTKADCGQNNTHMENGYITHDVHAHSCIAQLGYARSS